MLPDATPLREALGLYPQPVAFAVGRVVRARTLPEQLDAIVKAAEVLTRYTAVVSLASYGARDEVTEGDRPLTLTGKLAFGHYLSVIQAVVKRDNRHPVAGMLRNAFHAKGKGSGPADAALIALLNLRNREGHDLTHVDLAKAEVINRTYEPSKHLRTALDALEPVLSLPLLIVDDQQLERGRITATCFVLAGEGDPFPERHELADGVHHLRVPYLATRQGLLCLSPGLIWDLVEAHRAFGIFVADQVSEKSIRYKSVLDGSLVDEGGPRLEELAKWLAPSAVAIEAARFLSGPHSLFASEQDATGQKQPESPADAKLSPEGEPPSPPSDQTEDQSGRTATPEPVEQPAGLDDSDDLDWDSAKAYLRFQEPLLDLFREVVAIGRRIDPAIRVIVAEKFIEFAVGASQLVVVIRRASRLDLVLPIDPLSIEPAPELRDLRDVRHWGEGDLCFAFASLGQAPDLERLLRLASATAAQTRHTTSSMRSRLDRETLIRLIAGENKSLKEVANEAAATESEVDQALTLHDLRSLVAKKSSGHTVTADQVHRYEDGVDIGVIASELEVSQHVALKCLVNGGAELRPDDSARINGRQPTIPRRVLEAEFLSGKRTLQAIGNDYRLTHEGVRQILKKYGMPTSVDRTTDPAEKISEARLRHMYVTKGLSLAEIGRQVGLRAEEVGELAARWELARPRVHERHGLTKALLEETYLSERKSVAAIADELGVPVQAVGAALEYHGIPLRSRQEAIGRGLSEILTRSFLAQRLAEGASVASIAAEVGTTGTTVDRYLVEHGLRDGASPDPRFDEILSLEAMTRDYLHTGLSLAEYSSLVGAGQGEIRLRLRAMGLEVPRRKNTILARLPTTRSVREAEAAGPPADFPLDHETLRQLYVVEDQCVADVARSADRSSDEVLRALRAADIDVRIGFEDLLSEPMLRRNYVELRRSAREIAQEIGITDPTVKKALRKYRIPVRSRAEARASTRPELDQLTEEMLRRECVERGRSATSVAQEVGVGATDVLAALRLYGLPTRESRGGAAQKQRLRALLTAEVLRRELVEKNRSIDEVAEWAGTTPRTVRKYAFDAAVDIPDQS